MNCFGSSKMMTRIRPLAIFLKEIRKNFIVNNHNHLLMKKTLPTGKNLVALRFLILALLCFPYLLTAQDYNLKPSDLKLDQERVAMKSDQMARRVSSALMMAKKKYEAGEDMGDENKMIMEGSKVLVEIIANSPEEAPALLSELEAMGMTRGVSYQRVINGYIDIMKIEETTEFPAMKYMTYVPTPETNIGSVTSQGKDAMNLDIADVFTVTGKGIKIGVLSDSYNALGGEAAGIASGDLPGPGNPLGNTTPVDIVEDLIVEDVPILSDEGRGMIELIHDVAPRSELAFATAFTGPAGFANNIIRLRNDAECDIIIDDISIFTAPVYQDGIVSQAVDIVTADGANYFSSAGNSADRSYEEPLRLDGTFDARGYYELHDFTGNGDYLHGFTIQPGGSFRMSLWWDEPYFSVSGAPGASSDLDIVFFEDDGNFLFASDNANVGNDPNEFITVRLGPSAPGPFTAFMAIGRWAPEPSVPNVVKYALFNEDGVAWQFDDRHDKSTVFAHPNSAGAMATGASAYFNTPAFGDDPAIINGFSSVGGTPILFDIAGNRLPSAIVRQKPDFVGPDGGNTTFFGQDIEPDGFPNFFGTSASAPHLGALAALLKERYKDNGVETPTSVVRPLFIQAASDMGDPGFDFRTGWGYIDGDALLRATFEFFPLPTMSQRRMILMGVLVLGAAIFMFINMRPGK